MRVIYIDDDATNRAVVKDMLGASGMSTDEAATVQVGLQMISKTDYDAVLMDLRMPGVNGITGIRQVRSRTDEKSQLPIIVISADMSDGARQLCTDAGADGFLEKPIMMSELFHAIGLAMAKSGDAMLA